MLLSERDRVHSRRLDRREIFLKKAKVWAQVSHLQVASTGGAPTSTSKTVGKCKMPASCYAAEAVQGKVQDARKPLFFKQVGLNGTKILSLKLFPHALWFALNLIVIHCCRV